MANATEAQPPAPIRIWNRALGHEEIEQVYGERWIRWAYGTGLGPQLARARAAQGVFSAAYGWTQSLGLSARKVSAFVREHAIPINQFEPGPFKSFNDFFIRRFRSGVRPFTRAPGDFPAFAEGRYLAFDQITLEQMFLLKGLIIDLPHLLGSRERAAPFAGGTAVFARLCPVDYHRFHYPDAGTTLERVALPGGLHSVNPIALAQNPGILMTNARVVNLLQTQNFGRIALIPVGALGVGRIVHAQTPDHPFARGDEMGHFLFGGSSVLMLASPGRLKIDTDLLSRSRTGMETLLRLGERIGLAG